MWLMKIGGTLIGSSWKRNVLIKKERDHEICYYGRGNQHPRTERFDYDISMKYMKALMKSKKERDP